MTREKLQIKTEAELCVAFIEQMNKIDGWTCYPETAGFDILVVHEDGRQIGVEAKMRLNAKVADQILPGGWSIRYGTPGPDHRLVIVGGITDASEGIAKMLGMMGVEVLKPWKAMGHGFAWVPDFRLQSFFDHRGRAMWGEDHLFDWNPPERCAVPCVVPDVPAGVPAPMKLTPWKESAIRVVIQMRRQGWITAKQITQHGISASIWTSGPTAWLQKGLAQGQWIPTDRLPNFQQQHPGAYAKIEEQEQAKLVLEIAKTIPAQSGLDLQQAPQ